MTDMDCDYCSSVNSINKNMSQYLNIDIHSGLGVRTGMKSYSTLRDTKIKDEKIDIKSLRLEFLPTEINTIDLCENVKRTVQCFKTSNLQIKTAVKAGEEFINKFKPYSSTTNIDNIKFSSSKHLKKVMPPSNMLITDAFKQSFFGRNSSSSDDKPKNPMRSTKVIVELDEKKLTSEINREDTDEASPINHSISNIRGSQEFHLKIIKLRESSDFAFQSNFFYQALLLYKEGCSSYKKYNLLLKSNKLILFDLKAGYMNPKIEYHSNFHLILDFDFTSVLAFVSMKDLKISVHVMGHPKKFCFKAIDEKSFNQIKYYLKYFIENSKGNKEQMIHVAEKQLKFYKYHFICEEIFSGTAHTGDILLFRGFQFKNSLQRLITRGEYDHVALIVRRDNHLYVYETLSKEGCRLRNWKDFIRYSWNLLYEKISFRRLHVPKNIEGTLHENIEQKILEFIHSTEKMPYKINCSGILCSNSTPSKFELEKDWAKMPGYFCSSLIAAAYVNAGIISQNKMRIDNYMPDSFASKYSSKLSFEQGFSLSPEIIIDFTGSQ